MRRRKSPENTPQADRAPPYQGLQAAGEDRLYRAVSHVGGTRRGLQRLGRRRRGRRQGWRRGDAACAHAEGSRQRRRAQPEEEEQVKGEDGGVQGLAVARQQEVHAGEVDRQDDCGGGGAGRQNVKAGTVLYKVLWEGFPPEIATWEEEGSIHDEFIDAYEASLEAEAELEELEDDESDDDEA
eukprot:5887673-Prymnesium_polylepis.1